MLQSWKKLRKTLQGNMYALPKKKYFADTVNYTTENQLNNCPFIEIDVEKTKKLMYFNFKVNQLSYWI